tara:strand:+ start:345 stop:569 length:225 start_codon:yes stop_codon:yes gene_type:complete
MLTKGDLVRVKQDSFLYPADHDHCSVKRTKHPKYGLVLKRMKNGEIKVFVDERAWVIKDKCLQLIGAKDVRKIS